MSSLDHHGFGRTPTDIHTDTILLIVRDGVALGVFVLGILALCGGLR